MNDAERDKQDRFETLVIEHHVRLRTFVRSLGVDPDWVDDLAQEALLTAYRDWESFDATRDFGKWVRGIAANIVRNEIRKDARQRRILQSDLARVLLAREPGSSERAEPVAIAAIRDDREMVVPPLPVGCAMYPPWRQVCTFLLFVTPPTDKSGNLHSFYFVIFILRLEGVTALTSLSH